MKKDMAVLATVDGSIYCEAFTKTEVESFLYHENTFYSKRALEDPYGSEACLLCMLISKVIQKTAHYAETAAYLNVVSNQFSTLGYVPQTDMAALCDCFYYDLKDDLSTAGMSSDIVVKPFDSATKDLVQQSIRSTAMTAPREYLEAAGAEDFARFISNMFSNVTFEEFKGKSSTGGSLVRSSFLEECKKGTYEIGYEWNAEQMKRIRDVSFLDEFIPNEAFETLVELANYDLNEVIDRINIGKSGVEAIKDNFLNAIIVGKPGTGKTTTAEAVSAALGMPIYTVKNSKNTEEDTYEGMTKVVSGSFAFRSTSFLEAYEHGGIIVLEEFNLADPGVMQGALGQAIEYPFILTKDGYQEIRRHPMCVIISTMNTGTQGAREPNEALTSRAPITLVMEDPDDDEFLAILESKGNDKKSCHTVFKAYKAIIRYLTDVAGSEEMVMQVTLRHCIGALKLMRIGKPIKVALNSTMIGSLAIKDLALSREVREAVVETIKL